MKTVTIPVDLLSTLIDAADYGQDQKSYDAQVAEEDGDPDDVAMDLSAEAEKWQEAVSAAMHLIKESKE